MKKRHFQYKQKVKFVLCCRFKMCSIPISHSCPTMDDLRPEKCFIISRQNKFSVYRNPTYNFIHSFSFICRSMLEILFCFRNSMDLDSPRYNKQNKQEVTVFYTHIPIASVSCICVL